MRYFRLWLSFLKTSLMADMEYRLNVVVRVIGEGAWYAAQLSVFEVLYLHANTISGWDVHGMRVFMGCLFLVDVFYMIFFMENMDQLSGLVKRGDLDLYLVKPIESQFMVSCRKVATAYGLNFIFILSYLIWAIVHLPNPVGVWQVFSFVVLIIFGLLSMYSIRFMFGTLSVILHDAGNIQFIWHQLWRLGTRPDPIYPFYLRIFVLTVFPVAFFSSVPSRALVEGLDLRLLAAAPVMGVGLLWLSHFFWNQALKKYSSASS
jgi:ABC-2 type transport system permease protein